MLKEKTFLFLLASLFFLSGCSQKIIKPRVMNPPPELASQKEDSTSLEQRSSTNEFEEVESYYGLGVSANQEGDWRKAQEYFESALEILSNLDIGDDSDTLRTKKINTLLHEIAEDYEVTLLSLGVLSGESSISAFLERFENIENFKKLQEDLGEKVEPPTEVTLQPDTVIYDIPIESNERVENAMVYFQTVGRGAFERYLRRSGKYADLMRNILKEKGLPLDMVWLCLIESGFNPKAYSWARAVGPWQFIASTGRKYGLRRNWWYDERRDFVKSTYAACSYLTFLYNQFGSWPLALAGYNGGEGRIERAIQKHNTDNFWDLKLTRQTQDYVPLYMAATIIAKNPEEYGFYVEYDEPLRFDIVKIDEPMDLGKVAKIVGTSLESMKELNPELLRGVTPPNYPGYQLRVPLGTKDLLTQYIAQNRTLGEESTSKFANGLFIEHKIKKGETLSHLAKRYGVPVSVIMETNGLTKKHLLKVGQHIMIPSQSYASNPKGQKSSQSKPSANKSKKGDFYTVKKGDTVSDLATKFNTTSQSIQKLNGLRNSNHIKEGQKLKIPLTSQEANPTSSQGKWITYIVKSGDTLWDIARKFRVLLESLIIWNELKAPSRIKVGDRIRVFQRS